MWLEFVVLTLASVTNAARILGVYPTPSISHQLAFRPLTEELLKRGHEVVVITTDPAYPKGKAPNNLTEIDVHDISYDLWRKHFLSTTTGKSDDMIHQMNTIMNLFANIFEQQILTEEVQDLIKNKNDKFDLLLLETCNRPAWIMSHLIKAPTISISSFGGVFGVYDAVGAPSHPILYPSSLRQKLFNLTIWEKFVDLYNYYTLENVFEKMAENEEKQNKRLFGPDVPSVRELTKNFEMLFLNVHPVWEENRPVPPNVVYMGGIHQKPSKELPKPINDPLLSTSLLYNREDRLRMVRPCSPPRWPSAGWRTYTHDNNPSISYTPARHWLPLHSRTWLRR